MYHNTHYLWVQGNYVKWVSYQRARRNKLPQAVTHSFCFDTSLCTSLDVWLVNRVVAQHSVTFSTIWLELQEIISQWISSHSVNAYILYYIQNVIWLLLQYMNWHNLKTVLSMNIRCDSVFSVVPLSPQLGFPIYIFPFERMMAVKDTVQTCLLSHWCPSPWYLLFFSSLYLLRISPGSLCLQSAKSSFFPVPCANTKGLSDIILTVFQDCVCKYTKFGGKKYMHKK